MPPDLTAARDGLLAALKDGTLPRARLVEAVTRVLTLQVPHRRPAAARPVHAEARRTTSARSPGAPPPSVTVLRGALRRPAGQRRRSRSPRPAAARSRGWRWSRRLQGAGVRSRPRAARSSTWSGTATGAPTSSLDAAVTVAMDTPYLLAGAPVADAARHVLVQPAVHDGPGRPCWPARRRRPAGPRSRSPACPAAPAPERRRPAAAARPAGRLVDASLRAGCCRARRARPGRAASASAIRRAGLARA